MSRLFLRCGMVLSLGISLVGCSTLRALNPGRLYLYDEGQAKLAKEAKENFDTYRQGSTTVFDRMLTNLNQVDRAWKDSTDLAIKAKNDAFLLAVPTYTWVQLLGEKDAKKTTEDEILQEKRGEKEDKCKKEKETSGIKSRVYDLKRRINRADCEAIEALTSTTQKLEKATAGLKEQTEVVKSLKKKLDEKKKTVEERRKSVDGFRKAIVELAKGDDIALADAERFKTLIENRQLIWDPSSHPGMVITLLSLAIDLAEAERDRIVMEIAHLQKAIENGEKQTRLFAAAKHNFEEIESDTEDFGRLLGASYKREPQLISTVLHLVDKYHAAPYREEQLEAFSNLQAVLEVIGRFALLESVFLPEAAELTQEAESINQSYTLNLSKINARAREAIIGRGLEGLSIYHDGGIRPEEIAEFLYAVGIMTSIATN